MASTGTQNSLNALETRDITLPRRLWSWLVTQAKKNGQSVDEVIAALIDTHRHPEVADPDPAPAAQDAPDEPASASTAPPASASANDATDSSRPQGAPPPSANAQARADAQAKQDAAEQEAAAEEQTPAPESEAEREAPSGTANAAEASAEGSDGGPDTYSAADRLRKASDRLQHLMKEDKKTKKASEADSDSGGTQIQELLKNNDKLKTLEPPEPTPKKDPDEGVSMFDVAAGADDE